MPIDLARLDPPSTPALVLLRDALMDNLAVMQARCDAAGVGDVLLTSPAPLRSAARIVALTRSAKISAVADDVLLGAAGRSLTDGADGGVFSGQGGASTPPVTALGAAPPSPFKGREVQGMDQTPRPSARGSGPT